MRFLESTKRISIFLFLLGFLLYLPSFGNQFVWDDEQFIVENELVQNLESWPTYFTSNTIAGAGFASNYYRPLTTLSFAIDHALWGYNPLFFHFTNTFLHAGASVLLLLCLLEILALIQPYTSKHVQRLLALIPSLIFLIHPVQVEAVIYMNSRGDSLSAFFGFFALYTFLLLKKSKSDNLSIGLSVASVAFTTCAVLAKETSFVVIGLMLLTLLFHKSLSKIVTIAIQSILFLLYFFLRLTLFQFQDLSEFWQTQLYGKSLLVRLASFVFYALPEYLKAYFLPFQLHMEHPDTVVSHISVLEPWQIAAMAAFFLYSVWIVRNLNKYKIAAFGLAWFFITIFPFVGIIPLNAIMYEHWLYLPMVGLTLALFGTIAPYMKNFLRYKKFILGFGIVSIVALSGLTIRQMLLWKTPFTLYPYMLQFVESSRMRTNLGMAYAERGAFTQAIEQYERSIAFSDTYPQTHHNLANAYVELKDFEKAEQEYMRALELDSSFIFSIAKLIQLGEQTQNNELIQTWSAYGLRYHPNVEYFQKMNARTATE